METTALTLPEEGQFRKDIQAINKFQQVVKATMVSGHDYGVIPGTRKPTLLKPGAEKIAKLLGLADEYEIIDKAEEWDKPFFRYLIKCRLMSIAHRVIVSEGLGECNSMESKYRWRWVFQSELPSDIDKSKLVQRTIRTKRGDAKQYRLDNDDIYSQVNTVLKMAKKRALVDASLSAGRLSDVFTQDIEDIKIEPDAIEEGIPEEVLPKANESKVAEPEQPAKDAKPESKPKPIDKEALAEFNKVKAELQFTDKDVEAALGMKLGVYINEGHTLLEAAEVLRATQEVPPF